MIFRRLATVLLAALLAAGLFPAGVLAADSPVASADPVTTNEDTATTVTVSAVDATEGDLIASFAVDTPPTSGSLGSFSAPDCTAAPVCTATISYTPDQDANGDDSFTFRAIDAIGDTSAAATAAITVSPVNDSPSFTKGVNQIVAEDAGPQTVTTWATALKTGPANESGQSLSFVIDTNSNAALFSAGPAVSPTGTLTYTPAADAFGSASITLHAHDDGGGANDDSPTQTFAITVTAVNDNPTAGDDAMTVTEDAAAAPIAVLGNDTFAPDTGEALSVMGVGTASHGTATVTAGGGSVTYQPAANYAGTDTFTYTLSDGNGGTDTGQVDVTITPVNDPPSFTKGGNQTVAEDAGAQSVSAWATNISRGGGADEAGQTLTFVVDTNTNSSLFSAGPAVSAIGTLTYTPAADANGSATITLHVADNGGGTNVSPTQSFTITVTPVNDNPTAGTDNVTVAEDSGNTILDVLANDTFAPDTAETLSVTDVSAASDGTAQLVAGNVRYRPDSNFNGSDTFTYTLSDGHGGTATGTVNVTVTSVNDSPTAAPDSTTITEDAAAAPILVLGNDSFAPDTGETLSVTGVSVAGHGTATVTAGGGSVTYQPAANYAGTDTFSYTISDGNGGTATAVVTVTITAVNDAPSFLKGANQTVAEDSGAHSVSNWATAISRGGGTDEGGQTLTFVIDTNSNPGLFSAGPAVSATGTLTYTPAADANGVAAITLHLVDNGGGTDSSATQSFTITVTSVNDNPTAGDDSTTITEDAAAAPILVLANDSFAPDTSETLSVTGVGAAAHGTATVTAGGGSVTYQPNANFAGTDTFTYTLSDGNGGTDTGRVDVTITAVNDVPAFAKGADQTVAEDSGAHSVPLWATGITRGGGADESGQALTFVIDTNTNAALFAAAPAVSSTGTLTYTAAADASGVATITVHLEDNGGGTNASGTQSFTVTVNPVNDAPTFSAGADPTVLEDAGAQVVSDWATAIDVGPADESSQTATFQITSNSNPGLFQAGPAVAADGTLTWTPAADANGTASIAVRVVDDGGTANGGDDTSATQAVTFTVTPVNDAPSFTAGSDVGAAEDSGLQTVNAWATAISAGAGESGQAVSFEISNVSDPTLFAVQPQIDASGTLTFRAAGNRSGSSTLDVVLSDDGGTANGGVDATAPVTLTITVSGANDAPIASNDTVTVRLTGPTPINVATNDSGGPNEPGDVPLITSVRETTRGIVTITGGGTGLTYDPVGCSTGSDTFTYTVTDGGGLTDEATVLVTIASPTTVPTADAPVAAFLTGGTLSSTVPVKLSWCGLTSGTTVKSYKLSQSVNGGATTTLISATTARSTTRNLAQSPTRYQFKSRVTDNKNRTSAGYSSGPDLRIVRYENTNSAIVYSSGWVTSSSSKFSGGSARAASGSGRSATLTYTGRGFAIVGPRSSTRGSFNVYVDGVKVTSTAVSERSSTTVYKRLLYARTLAQGTHVVKIVSASSARIDLDAILTFQAP